MITTLRFKYIDLVVDREFNFRNYAAFYNLVHQYPNVNIGIEGWKAIQDHKEYKDKFLKIVGGLSPEEVEKTRAWMQVSFGELCGRTFFVEGLHQIDDTTYQVLLGT